MLTVEVITDPNYPYSFWVEMSLAWADDSNNVSHLSISQIKCLLTQILILGFYSNPSLMKKNTDQDVETGREQLCLHGHMEGTSQVTLKVSY